MSAGVSPDHAAVTIQIDQPETRVVLVGRTGLDAALRLDPSIELLRAKTLFDAIGELSDPIDPASHAGATVVVAPDADPGDSARAFVGSLRIVDPSVRVLVVGNPSRSVYDGSIAPGEPAEVIRAAVRRAPPSSTPPAAPPSSHVSSAMPSSQSPAAPPTPVPAMQTAPQAALPAPSQYSPIPSPAANTAAQEASLLESLLTGRDLLLAAMDLLRLRAGASDVVFADAQDPTAQSLPVAVPVEYRSHRFGSLSSRTLDAARLTPHARWLGLWLAVGEQHAQLRQSAFSDDLTGAYNRRYFDRFLPVVLDRARRDRHSVTLLFFDIDDFKQYNDRFGHAAGDEILRETVRLLQSVVRPSDRVCRVGGDEFVVIFNDHEGDRPPQAGQAAAGSTPSARDPASKPPSSIWDLAQRFQRQICEHRFPKLAEEAPGTLTISGGMATFPWDGASPAELLARADELAIQSKRQGKNVITLGPGAERVCRVNRS